MFKFRPLFTEKPQRTRKRKLLKADELLLPDIHIKPVGSKKHKAKNNLPKKSCDEGDSSEAEEHVKTVAAKVVLENLAKENRTAFDLWSQEGEEVFISFGFMSGAQWFG